MEKIFVHIALGNLLPNKNIKPKLWLSTFKIRDYPTVALLD